MVDEKIEPALTAKEWDTSSIWRGEHMVAGTNTGFDVRLNAGGGNPGRAYGEFPTSDLPAIMALANQALPDGHPLKIGEDMVDAMEDAADLLGDGVADEGYKMALSKTLRTHAAALRALLPPEG